MTLRFQNLAYGLLVRVDFKSPPKERNCNQRKALKLIDYFLCYRQQRLVVNEQNLIGSLFCLMSHGELSLVPCCFLFFYYIIYFSFLQDIHHIQYIYSYFWQWCNLWCSFALMIPIVLNHVEKKTNTVAPITRAYIARKIDRIKNRRSFVSTVSKKFKINLESQKYVHFEVILFRNVKIFGIMVSL